MEPVSKPATQRLTHIEIFRVITMFMIVAGHLIYHGIRLNPELNTFSISSPSDMTDYVLLQILSLFTSTGVNCFILISGYFLIEKTEMRKSLFKIWFQTAFYSLALGLIFWIFGTNPYSLKQILDDISPLPMSKYWFVTQYMGMALLAPFLSRLAQSLNQRQMLFLLGFLFVLFYNIPFGKNFATGMSLNWFVFLFFVGGYIRKYGMPDIINKHIAKWLILSVTFFFLIHFTSNYLRYLSSGADFTIKSTANNDLTFFVSVFLFVFFVNKTWKNTWLIRISKLAPYTFGIYLCHEHPAMRAFLWSEMLPQYIFCPLIVMTLLYSILLFLSCAGIDLIREKLFVWCGINRAAQKLGQKMPLLFQTKTHPTKQQIKNSQNQK